MPTKKSNLTLNHPSSTTSTRTSSLTLNHQYLSNPQYSHKILLANSKTVLTFGTTIENMKRLAVHVPRSKPLGRVSP